VFKVKSCQLELTESWLQMYLKWPTTLTTLLEIPVALQNIDLQTSVEALGRSAKKHNIQEIQSYSLTQEIKLFDQIIAEGELKKLGGISVAHELINTRRKSMPFSLPSCSPSTTASIRPFTLFHSLLAQRKACLQSLGRRCERCLRKFFELALRLFRLKLS